MKISTKGRYALRVMIDLAENQPAEGYLPLKTIAARQEISEKYLESIIKILVKGNVLVGLRGKGGGYRLTKSPEKYTVGDILRLTEDSLAPVTCLVQNNGTCSRMDECRTFNMWKDLDILINNFFDGITIDDLASCPTNIDNYII